MARARNIKPSFFTDDELGELEPLARLLYIGMWTLADYKGEFEYRAKRVKIQILPFDDCDVDSLAISLDKSGFIRFYSDGEKTYCSVRNFDRHQNPHKNERDKGSDIPSYCESMRQLIDIETLTINRDKNGTTRDKNGTAPADSLFLIPDSLFLIPDSSSLIPDSSLPQPEDCEIPPPKEKPKKKSQKPAFEFTPDHMELAREIYLAVVAIAPSLKEPSFDAWANEIRLMESRDSIPLTLIRRVFNFANRDEFWQANILCPAKLRAKFPELQARMNRQKNTGGTNATQRGNPQPSKTDHSAVGKVLANVAEIERREREAEDPAEVYQGTVEHDGRDVRSQVDIELWG